MPKCKICGKSTRFKFKYCKDCYEIKDETKSPTIIKKITKKEQKARDKATPQALKLHDALRAKEIPSFLELWDKHKHIDVAIPKYKINIEVDGQHHNTKPKQALADLKRTFYSYKKGYFTLRIPNSLVEKHFEECIDLIVEMVKFSKGDMK
jgi:very-short-patch-repair endonuclease